MTREMTNALADAIDSFTARERAMLVKLLQAAGMTDPGLRRLFHGIVAELWAADEHERSVLAALAADHSAHAKAIDEGLHGEAPPIVGDAWWPMGGGPE
jgi:hypothetical protein